MKLKLKLWSIPLIIITASFLQGVVFAQTSPVTLTFNPRATSAVKNQTQPVTMEVKLNPAGKNITAVDTVISYDKTKLDFLGFDTTGGWGSVVENVHNADRGEISYVATNLSGSYPQDIKLGVLSFKPKQDAEGAANVSFSYQKITATDSDAAVTGVVKDPGTINIGSSAPPSGGAYLVIEPATGAQTVGQNFTATIKLLGGNDSVSAVGFNISFDKTKLTASVDSISPIVSSGLTTRLTKTETDTGNTRSIRYSYGLQSGLDRVVRDSSGAISVTNIVFIPQNSPGEATVNFSNLVVATIQGLSLPTGTNQGATYTITNITPIPTTTPSAQVKLTLSSDKTTYRIGETVNIPVTFQTLDPQAKINVVQFSVKYDQNKFTLVDNGLVPEAGTGLQSNCTGSTVPLCNIQTFPALGEIRFLTTRTASNEVSLTGPFKIGTIKLRATAQTEGTTKTKVELISESINSLTQEQLRVEKVPVELEIKDRIFTKQYKLLVQDGTFNKGQVERDVSLSAKLNSKQPFDYRNDDGSPEPIKYNQMELVSADAPATSGPKTVFVQFEDFGTPPTTQVYFKTITLSPDPSITLIRCTQSLFENGTVLSIYGNHFDEFTEGRNSVKVDNQEAKINSWKRIDPTSPTPTTSDVPNSGYVIDALLKGKRVEGETKVEIKTKNNRTAVGKCVIGIASVNFQTIPQCTSGNKLLNNVAVKIAPVAPAQTLPTSPLPNLVFDARINIDAEGNPQGFLPRLEKDKNYVLWIKAPKYLAKKVEFRATEGVACANVENGECKPIQLPSGDISGPSGGAPDGRIDAFDYSKMITQWNLLQESVREADLNGDNRVNSIDYACLRINYNKSDDRLNAVVTPTATPTPTSVPSGTGQAGT